MASRVVGGKFIIQSSIESAIVAWEVKAIRNDVPPLEVITPKPIEVVQPIAPEQPGGVTAQPQGEKMEA